jgi:hypothetical protein
MAAEYAAAATLPAGAAQLKLTLLALMQLLTLQQQKQFHSAIDTAVGVQHWQLDAEVLLLLQLLQIQMIQIPYKLLSQQR